MKIWRNNLGKSQTSVFLQGSNNEVSGNTIFDTDVFDGVFILGDNNRVTSNSIFNSDEAAVWIDGDNNRVNYNTFNEAPIGIFNDGAGNNVNGNRYFNIAARILPAPTSATASAPLSGSNARNTSPAQP